MADRVYKELPTREQILSLLSYDPETGLFRWKETRRNRKAGAVAGSFCSGYIRIGFAATSYFAHRLAYVVMTGDILTSADEIDHCNGVKTDNRWANLRILSRSDNVHNAGPSRVNSSGCRGVHWRPYNRKWIATITVNGRKIHIGTFVTKEEAQKARKAAEITYGVTTYGNHASDGIGPN